LAKFIETESREDTVKRLNSSGAVMGTVPYMSPEQLRGNQLDARTDIFSFGALFYEMLSGGQAFAKESNAETISAILNDEPDWEPISVELRRILQKCMVKDVGQRYESAAVLGKDLRDAQKFGPFGDGSSSHATSPKSRVATDDSKAAKQRQFYFWQSADIAPTDRMPGTTTDSTSGPAGSSLWVPAIASLLVLTIGIASIWIWMASKATPANNFDALRPVRLMSWKTAAASNSTDFRLSHDGNMLAFSSTQQGGGEGIYIKQTSGGADHKVTDDSWRNVSPLWSPDDQQIAFVSLREGQSGIYISQTLGGAVTTLKVTEQSNISLRYWSRNGTAIYYEQAGNLYRLDLSTRTSEKITGFEDSTGNDRYFSFSPDEKQLAFCDRRDGQKDIWTMRIGGGEPVRLTNDPENELRPMWHPDGKRILYTVSRNDFYQINLTSTDGGTPVQVTRGEGIHVLIDISRSGDRIYYAGAEKRSDIGSVDLDSLREAEVADGSEVEFWPDASPDGKGIVYHVNASPNPTKRISESSLVLRSSDGQIVHLPGKGFNARWLPNSRHLAVLRLSETAPGDYDLWLIDTVSGVETRITSESIMPPAYQPMPITRRDIGVFDFSPDSKRVVYLDKQKPRNAKIGSVESREFTSLTKNNDQNVSYLSPRFSPDGARVALVSVEQVQDEQQKPLSKVQVFDEDGMSEVFSTTDNLRFMGWSAAGEIILATTKGSIASPADIDIVAASLHRSVRKLFTVKGVYTITLMLSPDGKTLAYTAPLEDRDDIWTASLTGNGSPRRITANSISRLFLVNPTFSYDGKKLYFDKQEELNSISMFEDLN
jgi:Tol biopolymer transport system component